MSDLRVFDTTVPGVLDSLRKGEWLVPEFQRDFVWNTDQVSALVQSVLDSRPIGMVTLWEQGDHSSLPVERLSIPDQDVATKKPTLTYFGEGDPPSKKYALLDGRQRCTAIAMAFGGFRAAHGGYKYSGRYFLDVTQQDPKKRVRFLKEADIRRQRLETDASCVSKGLFPLATNNPDEQLLAQWMRYLQSIGKPEYYIDSKLPDEASLALRNKILQQAFEGIVRTKLAVYVVPAKYLLSDICDIFETLNTTGTKVSTVDLIHAWLYADTQKAQNGPFLLREWISELGQMDGSIGWATVSDRPELIAQFVTACYVALTERPKSRPGTSGKPETITSIKSSDLLATPTDHWIAVKKNQDKFTEFLGDAQFAVAGGYFPWTQCPYPVSLSVYVALRWHWQFDDSALHPWAKTDLDALFRAFFWRNALTRRYDQGFLSQVGTDLQFLKATLLLRSQASSGADWAARAQVQLDSLFEYPLPTKDEMCELLLGGQLGGAMQKAMTLPMLAAATEDPVDPSFVISFPKSTGTELHHIYPREWCRNNKPVLGVHGEAGDQETMAMVEAVANQMPLSRESNNSWRQKMPAQYIKEKGLTYPSIRTVLGPLFIDEAAFNMLRDGTKEITRFWRYRAGLIASHLLAQTHVHF